MNNFYIHKQIALHSPLFNQPCKKLKRPVKRPLSIVRKTARRQLAGLQVIFNAVAAYSLARTGLVCAVAGFFNVDLFAFHDLLLCLNDSVEKVNYFRFSFPFCHSEASE